MRINGSGEQEKKKRKGSERSYAAKPLTSTVHIILGVELISCINKTLPPS